MVSGRLCNVNEFMPEIVPTSQYLNPGVRNQCLAMYLIRILYDLGKIGSRLRYAP